MTLTSQSLGLDETETDGDTNRTSHADTTTRPTQHKEEHISMLRKLPRILNVKSRKRFLNNSLKLWFASLCALVTVALILSVVAYNKTLTFGNQNDNACSQCLLARNENISHRKVKRGVLNEPSLTLERLYPEVDGQCDAIEMDENKYVIFNLTLDLGDEDLNSVDKLAIELKGKENFTINIFCYVSLNKWNETKSKLCYCQRKEKNTFYAIINITADIKFNQARVFAILTFQDGNSLHSEEQNMPTIYDTKKYIKVNINDEELDPENCSIYIKGDNAIIVYRTRDGFDIPSTLEIKDTNSSKMIKRRDNYLSINAEVIEELSLTFSHKTCGIEHSFACRIQTSARHTKSSYPILHLELSEKDLQKSFERQVPLQIQNYEGYSKSDHTMELQILKHEINILSPGVYLWFTNVIFCYTQDDSNTEMQFQIFKYVVRIVRKGIHYKSYSFTEELSTFSLSSTNSETNINGGSFDQLLHGDVITVYIDLQDSPRTTRVSDMSNIQLLRMK